MAYVAVRGGKQAINASIESLTYQRLKSGTAPDANIIEQSMHALIDQVMAEGSLYSETIAALAVKQAEGSPEEAVFLLRAFRSTLPRKHYSMEVDTTGMRIERRISAAFKDIPGGQILGTSADYTHRLIDFGIFRESPEEIRTWIENYLKKEIDEAAVRKYPKVIDYLRSQGLIRKLASKETEPSDVTKKNLTFPAERSERLQILTRGQTGAVTALGYAALRGYGAVHPTVGELRVGKIPLTVANPFSGKNPDDAYYFGEIRITEVESLIPVTVPMGMGESRIEFDIGYGICFGQNETKAIAMSILDQCLEVGDPQYPTGDEEFVLLHIDSVEATGFISHLKLPHYVTFQAKLDSVREIARTRTRTRSGEADHEQQL